MRNKKFKKLLEDDFKKTYSCPADYLEIIKDIDFESQRTKYKNMRALTIKRRLAFSAVTLFAMLVTAFIVFVSTKNTHDNIEDRWKLTNAEEEIIDSYHIKGVSKVIFEINLKKQISVIIYKTDDNDKDYYFYKIINPFDIEFDTDVKLLANNQEVLLINDKLFDLLCIGSNDKLEIKIIIDEIISRYAYNC